MSSCPHCGQSLPIGQLKLTRHEIQRLPTGNQHTKWNVVRWQAVKGAAAYYGVSDWTAKVDPVLSYEENIDLMRQAGTTTGPTAKEIYAEERAQQRWR